MDKTLEMYANKIEEYCESVKELDTPLYSKKFLETIVGTKILEIGSASTRDACYFRDLGYDVTCLDPVKGFYDIALNSGFNALNCYFEDTNFNDEFNGIWAMACLIHVKKSMLDDIFKKANITLKDNGVFYLSLRNGVSEAVINDIYYNFVSVDEIKNYASNSGFEIIDLWDSEHIHGKDNIWYNITLKKSINI